MRVVTLAPPIWLQYHSKMVILVLCNTKGVCVCVFSARVLLRCWQEVVAFADGGGIIAERRCLGRSHQLFMRPFCTYGASCQREPDRWRDNMVVQNTIRLVGAALVFLSTSEGNGDLY